jgi:hypothetical protein
MNTSMRTTTSDGQAPSFKTAIVGFITSITVMVTGMVLLGSVAA